MPIPKDEWVPRFAKRLLEMIPEASGNEAIGLELAKATYSEAGDLTPEEAVEIYLLEEPGDLHTEPPGAAGDA